MAEINKDGTIDLGSDLELTDSRPNEKTTDSQHPRFGVGHAIASPEAMFDLDFYHKIGKDGLTPLNKLMVRDKMMVRPITSFDLDSHHKKASISKNEWIKTYLSSRPSLLEECVPSMLYNVYVFTYHVHNIRKKNICLIKTCFSENSAVDWIVSTGYDIVNDYDEIYGGCNFIVIIPFLNERRKVDISYDILNWRQCFQEERRCFAFSDETYQYLLTQHQKYFLKSGGDLCVVPYWLTYIKMNQAPVTPQESKGPKMNQNIVVGCDVEHIKNIHSKIKYYEDEYTKNSHLEAFQSFNNNQQSFISKETDERVWSRENY